ncbi:MAG: DUF2306 domain-containing protein [Cytophagia bacterium]|nr:MAG: DUF2306 domain-containing protein [Cytophagia bacterium]
MNIIFKVFLIFHIVGGFVGLLSGTLNIVRQKGDKNHKIVGKIFFVSMLIGGTSSLVLSCLRPNYFLFMVGVFTLYMVVSGQHYLKHKQQDKLGSNLIGWIITIFMLVVGLLLVSIVVLVIIKSNSFGFVFITFGSIGLIFVRQDFKNYNNKTNIKNYWLIAHLQRMTGCFIAALTAFLVVNAQYFPEQIPSFIYWLLPTIILTPLIIKWSREYKVKKK